MPAAPSWPHTFEELASAVREEVSGVLRPRLGAAKRMAGRYGVKPTASCIDTLMRRGGKRFRAALTVAGHCAIKPRAAWTAAVQAGAALELLHAYLLVQDDWMDGDVERRGGPSVHVTLSEAYGDERIGAASAVLASDLAWGLAVRLMSELDAPPSRRVQALSMLMRCHQEVIVGQQLDLLYAVDKAAPRSRRRREMAKPRTDIETVHALKTASYTVTAPLLVGSSIAGATQEQMDALELFARPLGVAFQLRDDLSGVFGSPAKTGKPLAGDLSAGKRTVVTELADERLKGVARRAFERVYGRRDAGKIALTAAVAAIEQTGIRDEVEKRLVKRCKLARKRLRLLNLSAQPNAWLEGAVVLVEGER
jgi:geranylgeranyl diphosphate synthase type I